MISRLTFVNSQCTVSQSNAQKQAWELLPRRCIKALSTTCTNCFLFFPGSISVPLLAVNLSVITTSPASVSLQWLSGGGVLTSYDLSVTSVDDGPLVNLPTISLGSGTTSYTVTGLDPGRNYLFSLVVVAGDQMSQPTSVTGRTGTRLPV